MSGALHTLPASSAPTDGRPRRSVRLTVPAGLLGSLAMAGAVIFAYRSDATKDVALWGDVSRAANYALVFGAALAAGLGAWQGMRERRTGVVELFDSAPRSRLARYARRVARDWAWLSLGLLVGTALCSLRPLDSATWGHLDLLLVVDTLAGLWLCLALGFLAGRWLPHPLTVIGVALVVYMTQGLTAGPTAAGPFVPLLDTITTMSYHRAELAVPRIVLFLALGAVALALAAVPRLTRAEAAGSALALLVAIGAAAVMPDSVYRLVPIEATSCHGQAPQVCVHPAYAAAGDALAEAARRVLAPVTGAGIPVDRVIQTTDRPSYDPATATLTFPLSIVDGQVATDRAAASMLSGIFGDPDHDTCAALPDQKAARGRTAQGIVLSALMESAGSADSEGTQKVSRFLAQHWDALRACTLPPKTARQLTE